MVIDGNALMICATWNTKAPATMKKDLKPDVLYSKSFEMLSLVIKGNERIRNNA